MVLPGTGAPGCPGKGSDSDPCGAWLPDLIVQSPPGVGWGGELCLKCELGPRSVKQSQVTLFFPPKSISQWLLAIPIWNDKVLARNSTPDRTVFPTRQNLKSKQVSLPKL